MVETNQLPLTIDQLKALANEHDLQAIVSITVARDGTITVSSYGEDKDKSKVIGDWAQGLWKWAIARYPFVDTFGWGQSGRKAGN